MTIVRQTLLGHVALLAGAAVCSADAPPGPGPAAPAAASAYASPATIPADATSAYPLRNSTSYYTAPGAATTPGSSTTTPAGASQSADSAPNQATPAIHETTNGRVGAMPVASERVSRAGARPLPIQDKWQHVVTTFECEPPPDPRDFSPQACAEGDLWDDYHSVNDRWWAAVDALRWRARGYDVPALVTQSPAGTPPAVAGRLPGAAILFGNEALADDFRNGARFRLGWWAVDGQFVGYQAEYFGLEQADEGFAATAGPADAILGRPFFNTNIGAEDASLLNGTGLVLNLGGGPFTYDVTGNINIQTESDIQSFALTRRHVLWTDFERNIRTDWLIGYRYFRLDEGIRITDVVRLDNPGGGLIPPGTLVRRIDDFDATNDFHGGEIGLSGEIHRGRWTFEMLGKLGIGQTHQSVDITGETAINPGGVVGFVTTPGLGGFLAQPGLNIGSRFRDAFTLLPEAEMSVAFRLTDYLQLNVGFNALYANRVVRPGNQIDRNLNPTFFPPAGAPAGPAAPTAQFNETHILMYGFSAGLEATW